MSEGRTASVPKGQEQEIDRYRIAREPFYAEVRGEVGLFTIAAQSRMPVMLKGPTGCGKTRFVQHMAWRLKRPLVTSSSAASLTPKVASSAPAFRNPLAASSTYGRRK